MVTELILITMVTLQPFFFCPGSPFFVLFTLFIKIHSHSCSLYPPPILPLTPLSFRVLLLPSLIYSFVHSFCPFLVLILVSFAQTHFHSWPLVDYIIPSVSSANQGLHEAQTVLLIYCPFFCLSLTDVSIHAKVLQFDFWLWPWIIVISVAQWGGPIISASEFEC